MNMKTKRVVEAERLREALLEIQALAYDPTALGELKPDSIQLLATFSAKIHKIATTALTPAQCGQPNTDNKGN